MSLKNISILFKKEVKSYFNSPLPYLVGAFFLALTGWLFFSSVVYTQEKQVVSVTRAIILPVFGNINFLFIFVAPLLTMKLFAGEKKSSTIDLLLTSSLSHLDIILGKFFAGMVVMLGFTALTFIFPVIMAFAGHHDWTPVLLSYIGTILNFSVYLAIGLFVSSLTENIIISSFISFCSLLFLLMLSQSSLIMGNYYIGKILSYFSSSTHFFSFTQGVINSSHIVYYLTVVGFFIYLTDRSLESRNW